MIVTNRIEPSRQEAFVESTAIRGNRRVEAAGKHSDNTANDPRPRGESQPKTAKDDEDGGLPWPYSGA